MLLFVVVSYQFKSLFSFSVRKSFSQWFFAAAKRNDSLCKTFLIIVLMLSQSLFDCFVICRYMLCCLLYETLVSFLIHMCLLLIPWQWYFELWKNVKHVNRSFFQYFDATNLFSVLFFKKVIIFKLEDRVFKKYISKKSFFVTFQKSNVRDKNYREVERFLIRDLLG